MAGRDAGPGGLVDHAGIPHQRMHIDLTGMTDRART